MQFSSLFAVLAAGLALVSAETSGTSTTTSTKTVTATVTITQCNPTITNCPARLTALSHNTTSAYFPVSNSTKTVGPTAAYGNTTSFTFPASVATVSVAATSAKGGATQPAAASPSSETKSGAGSLFIQSGLLLGVVGAGMAVLA